MVSARPLASRGPLAIYPYAWKPIDNRDGISTRDREDWLFDLQPQVRPPEPVYNPAPSDQRLTSAPFNLLRAMADGATLTKHVFE